VKQDQEALDMMWQVWLRSMRVFCVSEVHDDLLMWAHYADCHRGAVIQLRCIPEKDTALCAARRIDYRATIPAIANTAEEWAAHITGESRIDLKGRFFDVVFTKSDHWSYEKEWRCYSSARIGDNRPGEAMTLDPEVIMAVYLGCRMPPKDRDGVVRLVRERLMHVRVFQARQSASTFSLEFEPIT